MRVVSNARANAWENEAIPKGAVNTLRDLTTATLDPLHRRGAAPMERTQTSFVPPADKRVML